MATGDSSAPYLDVSVVIQTPQTGASVAQVMTRPYALYKIPRGQWHRIRFWDADKRLLAELLPEQ